MIDGGGVTIEGSGARPIVLGSLRAAPPLHPPLFFLFFAFSFLFVLFQTPTHTPLTPLPPTNGFPFYVLI